MSPGREVKQPATSSNPVDAAMARAVALVDAGGAAQLVEAALRSQPAGNAGWLVPIEPLLGVEQTRAAWAVVLRVLRMRAV